MIEDIVHKVVVINLPHRKDRLNSMTNQLNNYEIPFEVFPALSHPLGGAIGLKYTLLSLFAKYNDLDFLAPEDYKPLLVLEDDAVFTLPKEDLYSRLKNILAELPFTFDMCMLGANIYKPPIDFSENLYKVEGSVANHAVLYSPRIVNTLITILAQQLRSHVPSDVLFDRSLSNNFCSKQPLAIQASGYSSIVEARIDYTSFDWHNGQPKNIITS